MNLRNENAGEESSNHQSASTANEKNLRSIPDRISGSMRKINCWSVSEGLEERKVQSNQTIYAGSWNVKT